MTKTIREILRQFADTGNLDAQYVTLEEYEALQINAGNMSQEKERDIIRLEQIIFELHTEIANLDKQHKTFIAILRQWADKAGDGLIDDTFNGVRSPELQQLVAATKAVLGE